MRRMVSLSCAICVCLWLMPMALAGEQQEEKATPFWQPVPAPSWGVEPGGTLWTLVGGKPRWSDGKNFHDLKNADELGNAVAFGLYVGRDRPLVMATRNPDQRSGSLYVLKDGRANRVVGLEAAHFPFKEGVGHLGTDFHMSRSGLFFSYSPYRVGMLLGGEWRQLISRPGRWVSFLDVGEMTYVHYRNGVWAVPPGGEIVKHTLGGMEWPEDVGGPGDPVFALPWGNDKLLVVLQGSRRTDMILDEQKKAVKQESFTSSELLAYELKTLEPVDLGDVREALKDHVIHDAFCGPSGSVVLHLRKRGEPCSAPGSFRMLTTDGKLHEIKTTIQWPLGPHGYPRSRSVPGSVLLASDNTLWLALSNGVAGYENGGFTVLGPDDGIPGPVIYLVEAPKSGGVFVVLPKGVLMIGGRETARGAAQGQ